MQVHSPRTGGIRVGACVAPGRGHPGVLVCIAVWRAHRPFESTRKYSLPKHSIMIGVLGAPESERAAIGICCNIDSWIGRAGYDCLCPMLGARSPAATRSACSQRWSAFRPERKEAPSTEDQQQLSYICEHVMFRTQRFHALDRN